jgi:hypothetical protein
MSAPVTLRLPLAQLVAVTGLSTHEIELMTGRKCREDLTPLSADHVTVALGLTPGFVWGDAWWSLPDGALGSELTKDEKRQRKNADRVERQRRTRAERREMAA